MICRGDIRWFRFDLPTKRRPVLVLGRDDLLHSLSQVPVVPLSTQIRGLPWEVVLGVDSGLPGKSTLKLEWIRAVESAEIGPRITSFPPDRWPEVRAALLFVTGFDRI